VPEEVPHQGLERVRHQLRMTGVRDEAFSRLVTGIHTRGYLPHVKREGASYFVTFRVVDSLPREVVLELERKRAEAVRSALGSGIVSSQTVERDHRRHVELALDRGYGACHLRRPEIALLVADALRYFDGKQYHLDEWVVMPNHVHVILWPMPNHCLTTILQGRKRRTAREANRILGTTGQPFWQPESYDHWIRNDEEKARIRRYIRNNPVKAGLCRTAEEWRWGSAWAGWKAGGVNPP